MKFFSNKDIRILGGALAAAIVAGVCGHDRFGPIVAFITAALALSLLALVVGEATDQLGSRLGAGATGILQSAFGNLPELFVCIFSLKAGLIDVVKSALVGSILANSLLVLGLAILIGGLKHGTQKFHSEPPRMISTLMMLAVAALLIPTLAHQLHTPAEKHEASMSGVCSIVLLVVFIASLTFFLKRDPTVVPTEDQPSTDHVAWPLPIAMGVLVVAGIGAAFVSEWFVDALKPATQAMGISEAFAGLVIVAIAGNAIENLVGIQLAAANKMDYAVSVVLNSSLQIALVLVPLLVLISFFVGAAPMTLVLSPLLAASLVLAAIVPTFIVFDGESIWLEGLALVGLYIVIATAFWWG